VQWPGGTTKRLLQAALGVLASLQVLGGGWALATLPATQVPPPPPVAPVAPPGPMVVPPPPPPQARPAPPPPIPPEDIPAPGPAPEAAAVPAPPPPVPPEPAPQGPVNVKPLGDLLRGLLPVVGTPKLAL
jgi:hypothetical protein